MPGYFGDIRLGDTIDVKFCTVSTAGVPTTLAGSPAVAAYVGNSTTEITAGITLTVDFDSRTGLHNVRVVATSGNGFAAATNVALVVTAGTVGGSSVVGYEVGGFSIENRSPLMPTTAARTLDVSAGGEAGVDWANVGSPTTANNLSGTTIGTLSALANNSITAAALAADAVDEILDEAIGDGTVTMRQALRVLIAGMAGKLSGAAGTTITIRNLADSQNVIVATVDSNGNRSAVTVTP